MPNNTDAQAERRKGAIQSAILASVFLLVSAGIKLLLRGVYPVDGFWGAVLLIFSLLELGSLLPVWILLKNRLTEIEGGEEDAAAQY